MAPPTPHGRRVVVDGSNLATEGRSMPSLAQLDEAVRAFAAERPDDEIIVVVDASFGYRIDESERKMFEEAEDAGEIVSPPAGAVGRGDGFLLRIADRIDADVLSNDSFQEFHGEYTWLFDTGRLIGGKPVPGVGWIFTPRTPVRGPKSRVATRDADRARKRSATPRPAPVVRSGPTAAAIAEATAEAIAPDAPTAPKRGSRRRSRSSTASAEPAAVAAAPAATATAGAPEAVNEPLPFITFIAEHPLGTEVEGTVDSFTSHGAFVTAEGARCYAPVSGLGDPPPRSAKEVLKRGEVRSFVIQALDPPRRGIELALPGLARVAGAPTEETVEAEIDAGSRPAPGVEAEVEVEPGPVAPAKPRRSRLRAAPKAGVSERTGERTGEPVTEIAPPEPEPEPKPEPAAKPARKSRKKAVEPVVVEVPAAVPAAPVRKSRKKAALAEPAAEEAPKKAARSRTKAAGPEPVPVEEPVKKRPTRKKAAPAEPVAPAPVKKARKSTKKAPTGTE